MEHEPFDTRVINGRFVGPDAPADAVLTIHKGVVISDNQHDVWRTVDASGHLVFPGLIQPTGTNHAAALSAIRGGVTTAINSTNSLSDVCLDVIGNSLSGLDVIEPDIADAINDDGWKRLLGDCPVHVQASLGAGFPLIHFLYHEGHLERGMSLDRIAEITSGNAAHSAGLFPQKGSFRVDSDGDLFVFDPNDNDPYSEYPWPGRVIFSLLRGNILLYNGQIHTNAGDGIQIA